MGSMGVTNIAATFSSPTGFLGRSVNQTRFLPATLPKLLQSSAVPTLHPRDPSAPRAGHMVTMVPPRQVVLPCLILLPPPLCQHSRLGSLMEGTMIQMHKTVSSDPSLLSPGFPPGLAQAVTARFNPEQDRRVFFVKSAWTSSRCGLQAIEKYSYWQCDQLFLRCVKN